MIQLGRAQAPYLSGESTPARVYQTVAANVHPMTTAAIAMNARCDIQDAARALEFLERRGHVYRTGDSDWRKT